MGKETNTISIPLHFTCTFRGVRYPRGRGEMGGVELYLDRRQAPLGGEIQKVWAVEQTLLTRQWCVRVRGEGSSQRELCQRRRQDGQLQRIKKMTKGTWTYNLNMIRKDTPNKGCMKPHPTMLDMHGQGVVTCAHCTEKLILDCLQKLPWSLTIDLVFLTVWLKPEIAVDLLTKL